MTDPSATEPTDTTAAATPTRPTITLDLVVLDTDDPARLAEFYADLLGWQTERVDDDWVTISGNSDSRLAFQLAPDFVAPTWPDNQVPQQVHLDLLVTDMEAATAYAESIGARRLTEEVDDFIVLLDPSGHPFCLCRT